MMSALLGVDLLFYFRELACLGPVHLMLAATYCLFALVSFTIPRCTFDFTNHRSFRSTPSRKSLIRIPSRWSKLVRCRIKYTKHTRIQNSSSDVEADLLVTQDFANVAELRSRQWSSTFPLDEESFSRKTYMYRKKKKNNTPEKKIKY